MTAPTVDSPRFAPMAFLRRSVATPLDGALTLIVAGLVTAAAIPLTRWAILDAVWSGTADDCRASGGGCWAFVGQKMSFILFGLYPLAERWRAGLALTLLIALIVATTVPRFSGCGC